MGNAKNCGAATISDLEVWRETPYDARMGDKSPKATQKQKSQKTAKGNAAQQQKSAVAAAKAAPKPGKK